MKKAKRHGEATTAEYICVNQALRSPIAFSQPGIKLFLIFKVGFETRFSCLILSANGVTEH